MSLKHNLIAASAAAMTMLATSAFAVDKPLDFVTKAAQANMFEIQSSQLALKLSKNPEVITLAKEMIADHTKAEASLKTAAHTTRLLLPKALDKDNKAKLKDLKKKGDDFDKSYINEQVDAHNDAVNLFTDYSKNGTEAHLKAFAIKTLPALLTHKDHFDAAKAKM